MRARGIVPNACWPWLACGDPTGYGRFVYENADGTATVSYVPPSAVFAPYKHPEVKAVAAELDPIFKAIVDTALAVR